MIKKVVTKPEETVVISTEVSCQKYYGIYIVSDYRGFISRNPITGKYEARCITSLTSGNRWDFFDNTCITTLIDSLIKKEFVVFQFDTPQELMKWLSEV